MSQNNQRDFFGVIIPVKILGNNELSISEKFVYSYVASYGKFCADSNAKIASRLGISPKTVTRSLARLQQLNYIQFVYANNNNASRKIYDIYGKSPKKSFLGLKNKSKNRGVRSSFPQSFAQLLCNANEYGQNVQTYGQNVHTNNR